MKKVKQCNFVIFVYVSFIILAIPSCVRHEHGRANITESYDFSIETVNVEDLLCALEDYSSDFEIVDICFDLDTIGIYKEYNPESDFKFVIVGNNEGIRITGLIEPKSVVHIPPYIQCLPIIELGREAFAGIARNAGKLTKVTIPNTVVDIGWRAFAFNQLTEISIPDSVINLEGFDGNQLTSITIPNSVTRIGGSAFSENPINSVIIPNSVKYISEFAFANSQLNNVTISESVTFIGDGAFQANRLTSITIPNSVTRISNFAFASNQLTSVILSDSITEIGFGVFENNRLNNVTIPDNVTAIWGRAFYGNPLTSITIGANVRVEVLCDGWGNNNYPFGFGFEDFYNNPDGNNRQAGTFIREQGYSVWIRQ